MPPVATGPLRATFRRPTVVQYPASCFAVADAESAPSPHATHYTRTDERCGVTSGRTSCKQRGETTLARAISVGNRLGLNPAALPS